MPTVNTQTLFVKSGAMIHRIISKIPIKVSVPVLFTAPVLSVVVVLSLLFFTQEKAEVMDLTEQNLTQIHDHIISRIDERMKMAVRVNRINANLIDEGRLDMSRLRELGLTFCKQLKAFDMLSAIVWVGADGRALWVARYPNQSGYELAIAEKQMDGEIYKYQLDAEGQSKSERMVKAAYDPRLNPWYKAALMVDKPVWSDAFASVEMNGSHALNIAYIQPLQTKGGDPVGVIGVEVRLKDISQFLEKLPVGKTGRSFVTDRDARLIANSTGTPITDANNKQLDVSASYDKRIAAAAKYLKTAIGSFESIGVPHQLKLEVNEESYLLMISPSKHDIGLTWIIATMVPESDLIADIKAGRQRNIKIGIIAILITLLIGVAFAAVSLRPMLDLIAYVRRIDDGDLDQELKLEYSTEFVRLSKEINAMTAGLKDRIQCRHTLALAMEVQQNLLPKKAPNIKGLDMAGTLIYCDETGGDYYDYLDLAKQNGNKIGVVVGDVSDHGVQSALLMVSARALIRQHANHSDDIANIVKEVNWHLSRDLKESGHFMTLFLGEIDVTEKLFKWVRAGHDPGILYDVTTDSFDELTGEGLPLGVFETAEFEKRQMSMTSGQIYFIGTDGIWETRNRKGEKFGKETVKEVIRTHAHGKAEEILNAVVDRLEKFRGHGKREDDVTLVVIRTNRNF